MSDYDPTIPQPTQNLSDSQVDILNNFSELNTIFDTDHFTWNDATTANRGKHRKISYPVPYANSGAAPTFSGSASGVYAQLVSGVAQFFFKNSAGAQQISMPAVTQSGSNYGMRFSNGIILNMGLSPSVTPGSSQTVTLAIPYTTTFISGVGSAFDQDGRLNVSVSPGSGGGALTEIRLFAAAITGSSARQVYYISIGI